MIQGFPQVLKTEDSSNFMGGLGLESLNGEGMGGLPRKGKISY